MGFFSKMFTGVSSWSDKDLQEENVKYTAEISKRQISKALFDPVTSVMENNLLNQQRQKRDEIMVEIKRRGISETYVDPRVKEILDNYKKNNPGKYD